MLKVSPMSSTNPAPFIFTLPTCHMLASSIFLNGNTALRALLWFYIYSPFFKLLALILFTCHILMPRNEALKAKHLFAVVARDLSLIFRWCLYHNIFTFGIRTELFEVTPHHFLVGFKLFKLFICNFIAHLLDKIVRDQGRAPTLRAFDRKPLVSRLCDLKSEEITVAVFAESVSTSGIHHKVSVVVLFIANFAKPWIQRLLRLYKQLVFKVVIFRLFDQQQGLFWDFLHWYLQSY